MNRNILIMIYLNKFVKLCVCVCFQEISLKFVEMFKNNSVPKFKIKFMHYCY